MYLGKAEVFHSLSSFRHDNHFSLCKTLTPTACDGWRCAVYGFSRCRRCLFCLWLGKFFGFEASQLGCQELSLHIEQRFRFLWPNIESKKLEKGTIFHFRTYCPLESYQLLSLAKTEEIPFIFKIQKYLEDSPP